MKAATKCCKLVLGMCLATLPSLLFGQGTITSVTGASPAGDVNGITANSYLPEGFTLSLKGSFNAAAVNAVHWYNTATSTDTSFSGEELASVTATEITLTVPYDLFSGSIASRQTIQVYETEGSGAAQSNRVNFYLNPAMAATDYQLPGGTVGVPYTPAPLDTGGTGPYDVSYLYSSPVPGLTARASDTALTGTPTTAGDYYISAIVQDAWGNYDDYSYHLISIYPLPTITPPLAPSSTPAGSFDVTIMITGTGFVEPIYGEGTRPGSGVTWTAGGVPVTLSAAVISDTSIEVTVPAALLTTPVTAMIRVVQPSGGMSNAVPFAVTGPVISSLAPASAVAGSGSITMTVLGANFLDYSSYYGYKTGARSVRAPRAAGSSLTAQVIWGSTPLTTTFVNSSTLRAVVPDTLLATPGSATVRVVNPGGITSNAAVFTIFPRVPPLEISGSFPQGTVGVSYSGGVSASGGTPGYQFSLTSGSLPPGLKFSTSGGVTGTPTAAGSYRFIVQVLDSDGNANSSVFLLTVVPPALTLNGSVGDLAIGTPVEVKFTASGGVPPYTFSSSGTLPTGTTFSNGTLSGTPATAGTFSFTISVKDNAGSTASSNFVVKVTVAPLTVKSSLGDGQVGVTYSGQVNGAGGVGPYSFTATSLPPGITISSTGAASGTPTASGTFSVVVTVTDKAGTHASQTFTVTIIPAPLKITTSSLDGGTVGKLYSASMAASGGVTPYTWTIGGLPDGVSGSSGGVLSGTPTKAGSFTVTASVSDSKGAKASQSYTLTITVAPLVITSDSLPSAVVGTAVSGSVGASGGVPPYQWSAGGLPAGVTMSADGSLSGKPTVPGNASVAVSVVDSKGTTASKTLSMAVTLPASPTVNVTGIPGSANPASQSGITIGLGGAFPVDVSIELTMTFAPDSGADDPSVQFSSGGRTAQMTIPAGSTVSPSSIGVQTGTVAGLITITAHVTAAGQNITGTPVPTWTIRVNATPPFISSVTATRNSTGFTVTVMGYASSRDITQATFQFTAAAGTTLQTSSVTVPVTSLFTGWYGNSASAQYGSQFTYTQPFTVGGSAQSIVSVTVTLSGTGGSSNAVSANLQ